MQSLSPLPFLLLATVSAVEDRVRPRGFDCTAPATDTRLSTGEAVTVPEWVEPGMTPSVWRLAEAARAAKNAGDDGLEKCLLVEAEREARAALSEEEASTPRRFALAIVLGMRAEVEGGRTKVRAASELYEELVVILTAEPGHARARHMLGRLHAGVKRMGGVTRWLATNLLGGAVLKTA
ncbi:MAG: hypothetical protein OEN56_13175, partial [Gemmatimonadota bacterium]|nr:hypothetical protein [Gemmatimonadota bacterium]